MTAAYEVYYEDKLIGILEVKEGKHRYTPIEEGIGKLQDKVSLVKSVREKTEGFVKPIPFFQTRLESASRFGKEDIISYQTDNYVFKKIENLKGEVIG